MSIKAMFGELHYFSRQDMSQVKNHCIPFSFIAALHYDFDITNNVYNHIFNKQYNEINAFCMHNRRFAKQLVT